MKGKQFVDKFCDRESQRLEGVRVALISFLKHPDTPKVYYFNDLTKMTVNDDCVVIESIWKEMSTTEEALASKEVTPFKNLDSTYAARVISKLREVSSTRWLLEVKLEKGSKVSSCNDTLFVEGYYDYTIGVFKDVYDTEYEKSQIVSAHDLGILIKK